jgi:predicted patatin/cPLA2 family phospholipase
MQLTNNIKDTALIFEGGGMRASYTAGILNVLLENELYFDYVAGISAGSSHSVNYLSRDMERSKRSFVDLVNDPKFGGWKSFLKGNGFFYSQYIYEESCLPGAALPFNFDTFMANPAKFRIGAFDCKKGEMKYFTNEDVKSINDLMKIVRASSSLPILMPPTHINGRCYVDGGVSRGIALEIAKRDGMKKFFVVLTRPKGYRKAAHKFKSFFKARYRKTPAVADAILTRHMTYNKTLDELEQLEKEGLAYLVYPDVMPVSNDERCYEKLAESYELGYAQGKRDLHKWIDFLGL